MPPGSPKAHELKGANEPRALARAELSRGDGRGPELGPLRRCIVTHAVLPKELLVRFVVGPERTLVPDLEERLPGRGIWLQARRDVVETACAKGSFAKAARASVKVPDGLADRLESQLRRRCLEIAGLARRAGQVAVGFDQVRAWLREARAAVLVEAVDGAEGGRAKLGVERRGLPLVVLFTAYELGAALGREQAVHAALGRGKLGKRFLVEALRLAGFASAGRVLLPAAEDAGST